jgi:hypothetical protein
MKDYVLWERIKDTIDSCKTQKQLNVCRNMVDNALGKEFFKRENMMEYHNDLSRRIVNKRREIKNEKHTVLSKM